MNSLERVFATIDGKPVDHLAFLPITMQYACDRIGRTYRDYVTDYRVLVEAQLRIVEDFDIDHVSTISDPGRESADLGAAVIMPMDGPPSVDAMNPLLAEKTALAKLAMPKPEDGARMRDRIAAVAAFHDQVGGEKLIEGWVEGPCALGADLRGLHNLMMDFYEDPQFVHDLFEQCIEIALVFARAQKSAGADWMGVGDAAASLIGPDLYREFVFPYEKRLFERFDAEGIPVRLHICGNITPLLTDIGQLHCANVDLDWMVPVDAARRDMGPKQTVCGNIDPVAVVLQQTPEAVHAAIAACHAAAGSHFLVGAGCEIPRGTPPENLRAMAEYAQGARG